MAMRPLSHATRAWTRVQGGKKGVSLWTKITSCTTCAYMNTHVTACVLAMQLLINNLKVILSFIVSLKSVSRLKNKRASLELYLPVVTSEYKFVSLDFTSFPGSELINSNPVWSMQVFTERGQGNCTNYSTKSFTCILSRAVGGFTQTS